MIIKPCLKVALVIIALCALCWAPSILPGENDFVFPADPSSSGYFITDSDEFAVDEESSAEEDTGATSDLLTITTYTGFLEGHLITFPDGTTMSIDCADGDITTKSHFHSDHCADCGTGDYNRNNVIPGQVIYDKDGVTVTVVAANGVVIGQEPVSFIPCPGYENPLSMALLIKYKRFDYLTAGDLDSYGENPLGSALKERGVNIDVFKVSHHGSSTSTMLSFLLDILPEYAVIAGGGSEPTGETLSNLVYAGIKTIYYAYSYSSWVSEVYRANGDVVLTTDGITYSFSGGAPYFYHGPFETDDGPTPTPTVTPTITPTWNPSVPTYTPTPTPTLRPEGPWPMFRYDTAGAGQSCYFTGPQKGQLAWSYVTNGYVDSDPVVGFDGRVYVGSNDNRLYALSSAGVLIWSYQAGHYITSAPALDPAWTVYVGSSDDSLYALTSSGSILWSYLTGGDIRSSTVIDSAGEIYVGSDDNMIYAFSSDGRLEWSYETADNASSSPAVGSNGNIYTGSEDNIFYALNPAGSFIWSYFIEDSYVDWGTVASSPVIKPDSSICVGTGYGRIYAFSSTGSFLWRYVATNNYPVTSPVIDRSGNIYVGSTNARCYGLTPSGKCSWSYRTSSIHSSAAIGSGGNIYIGASADRFYALTSTGCLIWSYRSGGDVRSSPAIGFEGYVYVGSHDSRLYAFKDPPTPTPTVTPQPPTSTSTPTSTPLPVAENVLSSVALRPGDHLNVQFILHESIESPFTVFAVIIMPDGKMLDVRTLSTCVTPVAKNVPRLSAPFSYTLLSTTVPKGAPRGVYQIVTAFFHADESLSSRANAFLDVSASFTITD